MSHYALTRDAYIEQLRERYTAEELIYVPYVYTKAVLNEMLENYDGVGFDVSPVTDEEFCKFSDWQAHDEYLAETTNLTDVEYLYVIIKGRN